MLADSLVIVIVYLVNTHIIYWLSEASLCLPNSSDCEDLKCNPYRQQSALKR